MSDKQANSGAPIQMDPEVAQKIAMVAMNFQKERTGFTPKSVSVVRSGDTLVLTLFDALSPAERDLARTPEGALQVQEFHRRLFASSSDALRAEIEKVAGLSVREAAAEIELKTGSIVHVFSAGTMVQVFLLNPDGPEAGPEGEKPS